MIQPITMIVSAAMAAGDAQSHVVAHGIAPILRDWNIPLPFGESAGGFWFTNHLLMSLVAAAVMLLIFVPIGRRYQASMAGVPATKSVPTGFANLIEGFMDVLRTGVAKPVLGENTDRFMPFLWTVFFYILTCNLIGMLPLDAVLAPLGLKHIGGSPTGNVNVTAGLALCAFFTFHFAGVRAVFEQLVAGAHGQGHDEEQGGGAHGDLPEPHDHAHATQPMSAAIALMFAPTVYLWNFAPHAFKVEKPRPKPGMTKRILMLVVFVPILALELGVFVGAAAPGGVGEVVGRWTGAVLGVVYALNAGGWHPLDFADLLMWGFLFLLEVIGALVKPFALCIRLFANMVAGHMVLASLLLLIPAFHGITAGYLARSLTVAIGSVLMSCMEVFVAFLQAYIFMFLTTIFIGAAVHPEH